MTTFAFAFFFAFAGLLEFPVGVPLSLPPFIPSPGICNIETTDGGFALGVLGVDGGDDGGDGPGDNAAGVVTKVGVIP